MNINTFEVPYVGFPTHPPRPPSNSVSLTLAFNSVQKLPTVVIEMKLDPIADPAKMEGRFYKNRNKI